MKIKRLNRILDARLKECYRTHGDKIPVKYHGYIVRAMMDLLAEYDEFLLKEGYTDSDTRCKEPIACDRFLHDK